MKKKRPETWLPCPCSLHPCKTDLPGASLPGQKHDRSPKCYMKSKGKWEEKSGRGTVKKPGILYRGAAI